MFILISPLHLICLTTALVMMVVLVHNFTINDVFEWEHTMVCFKYRFYDIYLNKILNFHFIKNTFETCPVYIASTASHKANLNLFIFLAFWFLFCSVFHTKKILDFEYTSHRALHHFLLPYSFLSIFLIAFWAIWLPFFVFMTSSIIIKKFPSLSLSTKIKCRWKSIPKRLHLM